jgi:hypothetical protein
VAPRGARSNPTVCDVSVSCDTIEINRPQVESVDVRQSVVGRLLDYGMVLVRGTGGSFNPLAYASQPLPLRRAVRLAEGNDETRHSADKILSARRSR